MKTRTLATIAALAGLAFSTVSSAAWYARYDGVDGSPNSTTVYKKIDGLKIEQSVIERRSTRSQKPKEIVVVGSKPNSKPVPRR